MSDPRSDVPAGPDSEAAQDRTQTDPERHYEPPADVPDVAAEPPLSEEMTEPVAAAPDELAAESLPDGTGPAASPLTAAAPEGRTRRQRPQAAPAPVPSPRITGPYAIVETGGKQYRVSVGDTLSVERLPAEAGSEITLDRVLLLGGDGSTRIGTPTVEGAVVTARVEDHGRGEKIVVFKYKAKKRYRRRLGHRQALTRLAITGIAC